jgi:membrane protease YdiL (CAAX protease family)
MNRKELKKSLIKFIILTNVIFWVFFLIIGLCIMLSVAKPIIVILQTIAAWSSTFAFIILFKNFYSEITLKQFIKKQFNIKLNFLALTIIVFIQLIIFLIVAFILNDFNASIFNKINTSTFSSFVCLFFFNLFSGPLGEELGWRAFFLNELQKKYTPIRSSLISGTTWALWHFPLWLTSGFEGIQLIKYIAAFMVAIVSTTVIMTVFYNINKNLIIVITIHQLFNFFINLINDNLINTIIYISIGYFTVAILLILINPKESLYKRRTS